MSGRAWSRGALGGLFGDSVRVGRNGVGFGGPVIHALRVGAALERQINRTARGIEHIASGEFDPLTGRHRDGRWGGDHDHGRRDRRDAGDPRREGDYEYSRRTPRRGEGAGPYSDRPDDRQDGGRYARRTPRDGETVMPGGATDEETRRLRGRYDPRNPIYQRDDGSLYQDPRSRPAAAPPAAAGSSAAGLQVDQATLARLDDAQRKINTGLGGSASDQQIVSNVTAKMASENPGALKLYNEGGFARTRAGLNEFFNYSREAALNPAMRQMNDVFEQNPELGRQVVDQWRKDVRAAGGDPASPSGYRGGAATILDKLGTAAQNPETLARMRSATNFAELNAVLNPQVAAAPAASATTTAAVPPPPPPPAAATTTTTPAPAPPPAAPAAALARFDISTFGVGREVDTAMMNKLELARIRGEIDIKQYGQGSDMRQVIVQDGKVIGGFNRGENGATTTLASRQEMETHFAGVGKNLTSFETALAAAPAITPPAPTAPAAAPRVNLDPIFNPSRMT